MFRKKSTPDFQKELRNGARTHCCYKRTFPDTNHGAEGDERNRHGACQQKDIHTHTERPKGASEAIHQRQYEPFRRQNRQTRKHHGGDAKTGENTARESHQDLLNIILRNNVSAHPKRHVKDKAEDAANRKLPQRLLKKRAAINDDLKNKEKDVAKQLPSEEGRLLLTKCKLFYPLPLRISSRWGYR